MATESNTKPKKPKPDLTGYELPEKMMVAINDNNNVIRLFPGRGVRGPVTPPDYFGYGVSGTSAKDAYFKYPPYMQIPFPWNDNEKK